MPSHSTMRGCSTRRWKDSVVSTRAFDGWAAVQGKHHATASIAALIEKHDRELARMGWEIAGGQHVTTRHADIGARTRCAGTGPLTLLLSRREI